MTAGLLRRVESETPGRTGSNTDLIELLLLREIDDAGTLTGLETVNRVAAVTRLLDIDTPGYAQLHGLAERGLLGSMDGAPCRYFVTDQGRATAERLAEQCWPRIHGEVVSFGRKLAPAIPRSRGRILFAADWSEPAVSDVRQDRSPPR